ncbi:M20 family metallopeptidase [Methanoplanus sp. FWC-SCC4]|uniref:Probable succinyl-diaminopimelate desuccinylase n=1 Tax=Methanochimaera problematica TaxID=2609417 RepID=A0AA97I331_9EURY|nr:ArgE/DapE family deacylase [Methanoplanus sp. FWC-SCC4]WOF16243.1 M20 family metallopeptidase [Methanoplanus sp. FWC-SCC4]
MDVAELCSELVRIKSVNPPGNTRDVIGYIRDYLEDIDVPVSLTGGDDGRCNILTGYGPKDLLLLGHVDVVPAIADGWSHDPFSGIIKDGFVYGRGSTDMKGGCAALLTAFSETLKEGITPNANLCFVCDEENGGPLGVRHLLREGMIEPCDCIVAEPTPHLNPCVGQKGLVRLNFEFTGTPGHGSLYPEIGKSAIMNATDFLAFAKSLNEIIYDVDDDIACIISDSSKVISEFFDICNPENILARITYNPGKISGGEELNIVAQKCYLDFEMRIPWGCDSTLLIENIKDVCVNASVNIEECSDPTITRADISLVKTACESISSVYGAKSYPIVQWAASDARCLREKGFNVIEYGPGEIETLHSIDERVSVEKLKKAVKIYKSIIKSYSCKPNN